MASLTKIMTALVVVERTRPSEPVRITQAALDYTGSGIGLLPKGRRVRLEALLNGLLIVVRQRRGDRAGGARVGHASGASCASMNRHARQWGLRCTHFASSHGLEPRQPLVRARPGGADAARHVEAAHPRAIVRRRQAVLRFPIKGGKLYLYGHNPLMRLGYPGTIGLKTGYTDEAGRCFVGVVRRGDRRLGVVLLDSRDPSKHAPKLLDAAFAAGG